MKTIWRVVGLIALGALTLGAVCIVVGLITGGSIDRIIDALFANYDVDYYLKIGQQFVGTLF
ncbi:MAG: hypothetical protein VB058_02030 [Oscillospiraceae bacterium]|nr:hypothetical protein [Oscillospiraceae bacterium]